MNQNFRNIKIEDVLFFDIEVVKNQENIDVENKEFKLFRKKLRNKETDELPTIEHSLAEYNRIAGLKMTYNKVVCISVGAVKEGKLYLKSYVGEEKDIIESFYKKTQEYNYICGMNVLFYDLPMLRVNALRHGDIILNLPEKYNDSGKKEWEMKSVIDLMNYFKGSHYVNSSLDEISEHLGISSSKEGGIDGSQVSEVFYVEGVGKIEQYCKRDVFNCINIFQKFQFKQPYTEFIDVDLLNLPEEVQYQPLLQRIYTSGAFTEEIKNQVKELIKDPTEEDKVNLKEILLAHYQQKKDLVGVKKQKEVEINQFIDNLC